MTMQELARERDDALEAAGMWHKIADERSARIIELEREVARVRGEHQTAIDVMCNRCDEAFAAALRGRAGA